MTPTERRFDSRADYACAIDELLAVIDHELLVFDGDLEATGLESAARVAALERMLSGRRGNQLRIVLHSQDYVESRCPRLLRLARSYAHGVEFRQSPEDLRHLRDCFMVGDKAHAVVRFHADQARGKLLLEQGEEVGNWVRRFHELWDLSTPILPPTRLGL